MESCPTWNLMIGAIVLWNLIYTTNMKLIEERDVDKTEN